jgi:hypothetical protein
MTYEVLKLVYNAKKLNEFNLLDTALKLLITVLVEKEFNKAC